ncbi:MAG: cytochrome c [Leptospira sp.]|nr:cytochrome c [Leptospira sp.]
MYFFRITIALLAVLFLGNCESKQPPIEYMPDMYDSPAIEAQEMDYFASNRSGNRIPPEGTVPVGYYPYEFFGNKGNLAPERGLDNTAKKTLQNYKTGEQKFQTYCSPCHGARGAGNGNVVGPAPRFNFNVPSLVSDNVKSWTDGQIYHTITMGRGIMGSYAAQIEPDDRWKLILYLRKLQEYDSNSKKALAGK